MKSEKSSNLSITGGAVMVGNQNIMYNYQHEVERRDSAQKDSHSMEYQAVVYVGPSQPFPECTWTFTDILRNDDLLASLVMMLDYDQLGIGNGQISQNTFNYLTNA